MLLLRRIADELHAMTLREAYREVRRCVGAHELPIYSGAIAFQTLLAFIPLVLFGLGVLGAIGLQEQWTSEWAPTVRDWMSQAAFTVVDDTVRKALGEQQAFWLTAGALLSVWRISATTRCARSGSKPAGCCGCAGRSRWPCCSRSSRCSSPTRPPTTSRRAG